MKLIDKLQIFFLLFVLQNVKSQEFTSFYQREIYGVQANWHQIKLPNDVFQNAKNDFSDLRVYGISSENDTIEMPYLLKIANSKNQIKEIAFNSLNAVFNPEGHFFTFEIPNQETINEIQLDFEQTNFEWRVNLEGSQNQKDWFTILENERILSIQNQKTHFKFTKLMFPNANYQFYRVQIKNAENPKFKKASILLNETTKPKLINFATKRIHKKEFKNRKQTEIDIELVQALAVSQVEFKVKNDVDFYRPITIKYVVDSIKTEKGWIFNYGTLKTATLNSIEKNEFETPSTILKKLKIIIENQDNQPLEISAINVKGFEHSLIVRFSNAKKYLLTYGDKSRLKPNYDISHFEENIPEHLTVVTLGEAYEIEKIKSKSTTPLFENKILLWILMGLIMIVLGSFSFKMLKKI